MATWLASLVPAPSDDALPDGAGGLAPGHPSQIHGEAWHAVGVTADVKRWLQEGLQVCEPNHCYLGWPQSLDPMP